MPKGVYKRVKPTWSKGKKFSEEHKRNLSETHKGQVPWNTEKHRSEETRDKISNTLKGRFMGEHNPYWKGGKKKHCCGYILIYQPKHPLAVDNYILEHRLVMEQYLGRYLTPEEIVHHRGIKYPIGSIENKQDNRIENLKLFESNSAHIEFHNSLLTLKIS